MFRILCHGSLYSSQAAAAHRCGCSAEQNLAQGSWRKAKLRPLSLSCSEVLPVICSLDMLGKAGLVSGRRLGSEAGAGTLAITIVASGKPPSSKPL